MGEMRLDPTTMTWVISGEEANKTKNHSHDCPFCPGNEGMTTPAICEVRENGNWRARVFPDINPVFRIEYNEDREAEWMYDRMKNCGAHEIVVDHPSHGVSLPAMEEGAIACALEVYAKRIEDLKNDKRMKHVLLFKNEGEFTGSGIRHSHTHLVATPIIPKRIEQEMRWAHHHYARKERCLFCDMVRQELGAGVRIAAENRAFVALCPFASRFPYETWIFPKTHCHAFESAMKAEDERYLLSGIIRHITAGIGAITPHYHMVLHNSPNEKARFLNGDGKTLREDFHWHMEILPLLREVKRFNWEEEFFVNPVRPEDAAGVLKGGNAYEMVR